MTPPILSIRNPQAMVRAAETVRAGGVIVIPTETIYGIAALLENQAAIRRLYEVRERAPEPATPLLLARAALMGELARVNLVAQQLARRFWPGPLTLLLPPGPDLPLELRAAPVALRVPGYAPLLPLLDAVGGYLFVSGAIRAGHPPAITAQEAAALFGDDVALILDGGPVLFGVASTVVDCISVPPAVVRRGAISEDKLRDYLLPEAPAPAR